MGCILTNYKIDENKVKEIKIEVCKFYCQLIYEDIESKCYVGIDILKRCFYNEQRNRVTFEDKSYIDLHRTLKNEFKVHKFPNDLYYQVKFCGLFNSLEEVRQNISMFTRLLDKSLDKIIVKEC